MEDLMYVLAMNRLRAAYTEINPGVGPYLMSSVHDDLDGSRRTCDFLSVRRSFSQVAGSSMMFIAAVNAALVGLFVAGSCRGPERAGDRRHCCWRALRGRLPRRIHHVRRAEVLRILATVRPVQLITGGRQAWLSAGESSEWAIPDSNR